MSITFDCEHCGKSFTLEDKFGGKKGKCKQCGAVMEIPVATSSRSSVSPRNLEISPSRRGAPPSVATMARGDVYGFDDQPEPGGSGLPDGIEEVDPGSPGTLRRIARPASPFDPPRKKRSGGGSGLKTILKISLGIVFLLVLGFVGLVGYGVVKTMAGLSSKRELEVILQERIAFHDQLASLLSGVNDEEKAREVSPQAIQKFKAITTNLRKLKVTKVLQADFDALKQQYQVPQESASKQVVEQVRRIAAITGAWDALNVNEALAELDREERSIPGVNQVQGSAGRAVRNPVVNPGPPLGTRTPPIANPRPGLRSRPARPKAGGNG